MVNGTSIVRETQVVDAFEYFHVELDDHAMILADGATAETFIDNADRMAFDNWDEHERLYPDGAFHRRSALSSRHLGPSGSRGHSR